MTNAGGDAAIIARLLAGDEDAFLALVRAHQRSMRAVAGLYARDPALVEDVVQEAWVAVLTGLPTFEQRSALSTWILRIVANRARTRASREARSTPFSAFEERDEGGSAVPTSRFDGRGMWADPPAPWEDGEAVALLQRAEVRRAVDAAIETLPPRQRAVLVLRDVEGVDAADACDVLDISEANQRVLLHRARAAVRTALEPLLGSRG